MTERITSRLSKRPCGIRYASFARYGPRCGWVFGWGFWVETVGVSDPPCLGFCSQDEEDGGEITVEKVCHAFDTFDANKPWEEIAEILSRMLALPASKIKPNKVVAIPSILQTIKGMSVHRRTKKDAIPPPKSPT
jgi:hypothetical protein